MRDEFIAIGPMSVCALMLAGALLADALLNQTSGVASAVVALLLLLAVRNDARQTIASGTYARGWLKYTHQRHL